METTPRSGSLLVVERYKVDAYNVFAWDSIFIGDFKYDVILGIVVSCDIAIGDFVLWTSNR